MNRLRPPMPNLTAMPALLFVFAASLYGCDDKSAESAASATPASAETPSTAGNAASAEEKKGPAMADQHAKVSVAADGTKFDPPIDKGRLPDGVWYCDMKTVHYASQSEGDGACPYCGMKLKKFDASMYAKEAAEKGHTHGDHGHAHDEHHEDDEHHAHDEHAEGDHGHPH